eukprot:6213153-Pleurochrysis_carterae.AAC.2
MSAPVVDSQNFRQPANMTYSPICHWESGDRMAPLIRHSPSLQRRLLLVQLPIHGAEPHINHGLHHRGNRHYVKYSCRSDASDLNVGDISYIPQSACTAEKAFP